MTENLILKKVIENDQKLAVEKINNVLIIYNTERFYIGDSCIRLDTIKSVKNFLPNAIFDLNVDNDNYYSMYKDLLLNNPFIDKVIGHDWEEINFTNYDLIICFTHQEGVFSEFLFDKYEKEILNGEFELCVYSIYNYLVAPEMRKPIIFPMYDALFAFAAQNADPHKPRSLYITESEREWANQWMLENGCEPGDQVFIFLDSASTSTKLLDKDIYFDIIKSFTKTKNTKILIFDESKSGKRESYKHSLDDRSYQKVIFCEKLQFRKELSLLSSKFIKLIFGPCTGMMHCASGIYNNFVHNGMDMAEVPVMITYTGKYPGVNNSANHWWSDSPLMDCLLIREELGVKTIKVLNNLNEEEKSPDIEQFQCNEYTFDLLMDYINPRLEQNIPAKI